MARRQEALVLSSGWVHNISNGDVKVFLEGQMTLANESEIDRFKLVPWINKNQIYSSDRVLSWSLFWGRFPFDLQLIIKLPSLPS